MKNVNKVIGKMIRDAREKKGLTQMDLANELGYTSPQFISLFERGLSKVPYETLGRLAKLLNLSEKKVLNLLVGDFEHLVQSEIMKGKVG